MLSRPARVSSRRLDIQGLRAVAVIMVVVYHAGLPVPGGFVGVDVFFVISGYVITAMLQREWQREGRIDFVAFYLRRFKRLTPALALTVAFTLVVATLFLSPLGTQQNAGLTGLGALLLSANIVIARTTGGYFDAPAERNPLLNTWSLSVEEQFYLIFPIILAASWLLARRWRIGKLPIAIVGAVGVTSFALAVIGPGGVSAPSSALVAILNVALGFYSPITRAWEFAAGALLALGLERVAGLAVKASDVSGAGGVALLAASLWLITGATPFPGLWTLLPVVGTLLLLVAGSNASSVPARLLSTPILTRLGDWSYSIYLWHWPLIVFTQVVLPESRIAVVAAALLSIVPAYLSYRWVEEPIRALEISSPRRWRRLIAATVVPPLTLAAGLLLAAGQGFWSPPVRSYQAAALTAHAGERAGCDNFAPLSASKAKGCTWNGSASGQPIYLVGDSHADHLSEAAIGTGESLGSPVIISTTSNCPFVKGSFERTNASRPVNDRCRANVEGTLDYLLAARSGSVIIGAADAYWTSPTLRFGTTSVTATADTEAKLIALRESLTALTRELEGAGHRVFLVQTIPVRVDPYVWEPSTCALLDILAQPARCGSTMPLELAQTRQSPTRAVLAEVARATDAGLIDPGPLMCPDGVCSTHADSYVRMKDSGHISVPQSEALVPAFVEAMSKRD